MQLKNISNHWELNLIKINKKTNKYNKVKFRKLKGK